MYTNIQSFFIIMYTRMCIAIILYRKANNRSTGKGVKNIAEEHLSCREEIKDSPGGSPGSRTKTLVLATRTASSSAVFCPIPYPFIEKSSSPSQTGVPQLPIR